MKRLLVLLGLALLPFNAPAQHALTYSHLVIFGDNYSDTLNTYNATETISYGYDSDGDPITLIDAYPSAAYGYQDGEFTNGFSFGSTSYNGVWHQQINKLLPGIPAAAAALGSSPLPTGNTNFAWGSATTGTGKTNITFAGHLTASMHNMDQQIDDYLNAGYTPDAKSLYVLFGGLNDLLNDSSSASVMAAAANVTAEAKRLIDAGAVNVLIANVPGISANASSPIDTAAAQFRSQLALDLSALEAQYTLTGTAFHITTLDLYSLYANIMAKPGAFGFTDVMDKANTLGSTGYANVDTYLNWDGVNPTTAGHHQIALAACTALAGTATTLTIDKSLATQALPATLTATVSTSGTYGPQSSLTPTGTVTFYYPQTVLTTTALIALGSVPVVNGQASITTSGLPPAAYTVYAVYSGDANFATGCNSNTQSFTVAVASVGFDFSFSPTASYIGMEEGVALTLTPNAIGGFTGPVSFSCSSLPRFFSCDFTNNQTVQIAGNGTTYVSQLIIETKLGVTAQLRTPPVTPSAGGGSKIALASLLAAPVILLLHRGRKKHSAIFLTAIALSIGLILVSGCGGSPAKAGSSSGSSGASGYGITDGPGINYAAPGTYSVNITGTSGSLAVTHTYYVYIADTFDIGVTP